MFIKWQSDFEIGNEMIDAQHRMLVFMLRKLDIAFKQNFPHKVIIGICLEIKKFADFHFLSEENLMRELGYPEIEQHTEIHSHMLFQLDLLIHKVNRGSETPDDLLKILHNWIVGHVSNEDIKVAEYVRNSTFRPIAEAQYGLYLK